MKVSVSIPDEDVEFLDNYTKTHKIESRSAAPVSYTHLTLPTICSV